MNRPQCPCDHPHARGEHCYWCCDIRHGKEDASLCNGSHDEPTTEASASAPHRPVRSLPGPEVSELEVFIHQMPSRILSSNGARGFGKRAQMAVVDGKVELGIETDKAILAKFYPNFPRLTPPVIITLTLYARHNTKNGDGRYRAEDVFNIGGEVAKPIVDAFVKRGIIPDDDYKNVPFGVLHIEHVDRLEDEGISVLLRELEVV